jgi:hypothetical protein
MSDDEHASDAAGVPATLGASAELSFDTVDATEQSVHADVLGDDVGVELTLDLGAVRCAVVLDADATADLAARLDDCRATLRE